jgi:hypothetical protein
MQHTPCSLGLSATSQQYFSLRTNQPPATSQQYSSLRTNQHQPSATSQPNRLISFPPVSALYYINQRPLYLKPSSTVATILGYVLLVLLLLGYYLVFCCFLTTASPKANPAAAPAAIALGTRTA